MLYPYVNNYCWHIAIFNLLGRQCCNDYSSVVTVLISQSVTLLRSLELAAAPLAVSMPFSVFISAIYRKNLCSLGFSCQLRLNIVVIAVLQVYFSFVHTSFKVIFSVFGTSNSREGLDSETRLLKCLELLIHSFTC